LNVSDGQENNPEENEQLGTVAKQQWLLHYPFVETVVRQLLGMGNKY
jgi:hypothetical protein